MRRATLIVTSMLGCTPPMIAAPAFSRLIATPNPSAWGTWERLSLVGGAGLQVIR